MKAGPEDGNRTNATGYGNCGICAALYGNGRRQAGWGHREESEALGLSLRLLRADMEGNTGNAQLLESKQPGEYWESGPQQGPLGLCSGVVTSEDSA